MKLKHLLLLWYQLLSVQIVCCPSPVNTDSLTLFVEFVVSSMDSCIRTYNMTDGSLLNTIQSDPLESWAIALNLTNKKVLATTGKSGNVNIWDIEEGTKLQSLETEKSIFTMSVDFVCIKVYSQRSHLI